VVSLIDDGCSANASLVNKTLYTSFSRTTPFPAPLLPPAPY
jgi:hypothetical protein